MIITIYKLALYYFLIKINFGCSITVDSHVTKVHLLQKFLDSKSTLWSIIFLDSHSREKCVNKGKCVSTLIKGKHDTWLARRLTTYKYENENACLDKNLHQFLFFILAHRNNQTLHLYRPSYSISAIKIEIVPFIKTPTKNRKSFYAEIWFLLWCCHRQLKYFTDI